MAYLKPVLALILALSVTEFAAAEANTMEEVQRCVALEEAITYNKSIVSKLSFAKSNELGGLREEIRRAQLTQAELTQVFQRDCGFLDERSVLF